MQSNEANYNYLNAELDLDYQAFYQSTQYHTVVRSKACKERGWALN